MGTVKSTITSNEGDRLMMLKSAVPVDYAAMTKTLIQLDADFQAGLIEVKGDDDDKPLFFKKGPRNHTIATQTPNNPSRRTLSASFTDSVENSDVKIRHDA